MKTKNGFWMGLLALVATFAMGCVMDAKDWDQQHPVGEAGAAGAAGAASCAGTGGCGGNGMICTPGLWVDGTCPGGSDGLFRCNPQGTGFDADNCGGTGGSGGGNNCGPTCCPGSIVAITCPNNASGTATCNSTGTGWDYHCNGGTGGTGGGGGTGGTGATGGTGGAPPILSCQGDGVQHTMRVLCIAPANEVAQIDIKGGSVNAGDHRADNDATPWCEAWYNTPLASSSVQGANVVLDYSRQVQGGIAPRFQTYFRVHSGDPDGNTPHGFSYPEVQLHSNWSCQVSLDGVNLTDTMGQPMPCSAAGCAVRVTNATGDPKWINMQTDVYACNN